ncbi:MAG TPA: Glu-tRNA(Gln) amidotransferase subunit GatE [Candidatus Woesearchaeota archaeon]|nr:Glu-tRNA(Gln) amidotransferase subunit GatE [Candidatus Woesearchaeota archaeon]
MEKNNKYFDEIGFKSGIEIHQQLNTTKLFCSCIGDISDEYDFEVKRKLRVSKSELGDVDLAAKHEFEKCKEFVYKGSYDSSCLVELDEEPPHIPDDEILDISMQICTLLKANVCDAIEFMRKIVIDGSNTSGFQRTALIATEGEVDVDGVNIPIETICLEEDSAKIIEKKDSFDIYHLGRLGIPLVEIATAPAIKNPSQLKRVAEEIGLLLRSTNVKRGLGTIRQDVNVSVKGGARVEIKGAQDLGMLEKIGEIEAQRQVKLIEISKIISDKRFGERKEIVDLSEIFKGTGSKRIKENLMKGEGVYGIALKGYKGILGTQLAPLLRIGSEVSDYAKSSSNIKGLFHRDELPNYGITAKEVNLIVEKLNISDEDNFIIVSGNKTDAFRFLERCIERIQMFKLGVPSEVRKAMDDGTSRFMRPMPGAQRMYPETDIPLIHTKGIKVSEVKSIKEYIRELKEMGLGDSEALLVSKSSMLKDFFELVRLFKQKPSYIYTLLFSKPKEIKKRIENSNTDLIDLKTIKIILDKIDNDKLSKDVVDEILEKVALQEEIDYSKYETKTVDLSDIKNQIERIVKENPDKSFGHLMGICMAKIKGCDGKVISDILKGLTK